MKCPRAKKYPKKIDVGGESYRIVLCDRIPKDRDAIGLCDPELRRIYIKTGMPNTQTFRTFVHEVLHAMEFEYNIRIKHEVIYQLEEAIGDFLLMNF